MPINAENLVARAREHLTEQDEAVKFADDRLFALIPSALAEWIRRTENNPVKAKNFLVETGKIRITAGRADLTDAMDEFGIQSQFLTKGDCTVENSPFPVQFVSNLSRLTLGGIQDKFFLTAYFDGKFMVFRNPTDSSLGTFDGRMTIRAVSVPTTLENIPGSVEGELATILAEIARKFNTDGNHKGEMMNMQKPR